MNTLPTVTVAFLVGLFTLIESGGHHWEAFPVSTACSEDCPPYDEDALRHLKLILTDEDFHDFVLEAGAEELNPDSLVAVTDTTACAALDSALIAISAQVDPAYYEYIRYERAYFEGDSLYFAVEWTKPSEDPWQVVSGPSYFRAFGPNFVVKAEQSL